MTVTLSAESEVCSSDEELGAPPGTFKPDLKVDENFHTDTPL